MSRLVKVFSSAANLEDYDQTEPFIVSRLSARPHLLDEGADYFDEQERPVQPPPQTLKKAFSGSMLDLDEAVHPVEGNNIHKSSNSANNSFSAAEEENNNNNNRGMVALVGGSHFLNGHVASILLEKGYSVTVLLNDVRGVNKGVAAEFLAIGGGNRTKQGAPVNPLNPLQGNQKSGNRLVVDECDIYDPTSLRDAFRRCNCRFVIHGGVNSATLAASSNIAAISNAATNSSGSAGMDSPSATTATATLLTASAGSKIIELHTAAVRSLFEAIRGLRSGTLQRIVVTSSTSAVSHSNDPCLQPNGFDESHFNKFSTAAQEPAVFAKAHFESEVWRLAKGCNIDVSIIIPAIMLGPSRTSESSDAMRLVCDFARSSSYFPLAPNMFWNFVDVRDVALAHVLSLENENARNRRYIVSNSNINLAEIGRLIRQASGGKLKAPVYTMPWVVAMLSPFVPGSRVKFSYLWKNLGVRRPFNNARVQAELGLKLRTMGDTIKDSITDLTEQGMLPEATGAVDADWEAKRAFLLGTAVIGAVAGGLTWYFKKYYKNNNNSSTRRIQQ